MTLSIIYDNGTTTTAIPNFTMTSSNGTTLTYPDNTRIEIGLDGTVTVTSTDGTVTSTDDTATNADDSESTIEIRTETTTSTGDEVGVVRITEVTGETKTLTLTYLDKTLTLTYPDMTLSIIYDNGTTTTAIPNFTMTSSNGTTLTYPDNTRIEIGLDGTVTVTSTDGTVTSTDDTTTNPPDDTVTNTDGTDSAANSCVNGRAEYTQISTADELQAIDLAAKYCLANDIDLTGIDFTPLGYPSTAITGTSYTFTGTEFTGTLDGNGKKITGLVIDKPNNYYLGLFAKIGTGGEVRDLIIEDPSVEGHNYVGVLAGYSSGGEIDNVGIDVTSASTLIVDGNRYVGGLVGVNYDASITNSYSMGTVEGEYATGGLVGQNWGSITKSYATGIVTGSGYSTGGLVGGNSDSYSSIENSYFDTAGTEQTNGIGIDDNNQGGNVTGITTADITGGGEEPFKDAEWDFTDIWSAQGDGQWPEFIWQD